jgi:hypothetical protein
VARAGRKSLQNRGRVGYADPGAEPATSGVRATLKEMAPWPVSNPRLSTEDVYFSWEFQQWSNVFDDDLIAWQLAEHDIVSRLDAEAAAAAKRLKLATMPYAEYLLTPEWRERAERAKARAGWRCQFCNSSERLEAHHRTYERRGAELDDDLVALCDRCHDGLHVVLGEPHAPTSTRVAD